MTHYLRFNGDTIVDAEAHEENNRQCDVQVVVCISEYSKFLLEASFDLRADIIADFDNLQELRGEYFEVVQCKEKPDDFVKRRLQEIAEKYDLSYVTD